MTQYDGTIDQDSTEHPFDDDTIGNDATLRGLQPGHRLSERYELVHELGRGGMGVVWLARDLHLKGDEVAIKVLPELMAHDEDSIDQLVEEARVAMRLTHPGIMRLHNFEQNGLVCFLVMEYLRGPSLKDVLRARRCERGRNAQLLSETEVLGLLRQMAASLDFAHSQRVIHRDLKPGNLMFAEPIENLVESLDFSKVNLRICDFGIARVLEDSRTHLTGAPTTGTLLYMSPEQIIGHGIGTASDQYSLGCILYECLAGHPPFYTGSIHHQHLEVMPPLIEGANTLLHRAVERSLAKKVGERFKSAGELSTAANREDKSIPCLQTSLMSKPESAVKSETANASGSAHSHQQENYGVDLGGGVKLEMVWIEGGSFMMGSSEMEEGRQDDEGPVHEVELDGFWMGKYEVTNGQYRKFMKGSGYDGSRDADFDYLDHFRYNMDHLPYNEDEMPTGDEYPIVWVSWKNSKAFCEWLSKKSGGTYNLPTEAQWEYACRAGSQSRFNCGESDRDLADYAWYGDNAGDKTHKVGGKRPNALGLYDMQGNVQEWCADWYGKYASGVQRNPTGPNSGKERVLRGGALIDESEYYRSACRYTYSPDNTNDYYGFRVVCVTRTQSHETTNHISVADSKKKISDPASCKEIETSLKTISSFPKMSPKDFTADLGSGVKLEMVWIEGGSFMMGSPETEEEREDDEGPVHEVELDGFWMGKYEVMQAQYEALMGNNPSILKGLNNPVEWVIWDNAVEFSNKMSQRTGDEYRLPSEAQWEYGCRAGSQSRFCFGDSDSGLDDYAWHKDNAGRKTRTVGSKRANGWGLYDMHGNVSEWCGDRYGGYASGKHNNPEGPSPGYCRVQRGGSFRDFSRDCRSANRRSSPPGFPSGDCGFRVVCVARTQ